ncbi:MAG: DegV family protein [Coriobacteriia bacterium]
MAVRVVTDTTSNMPVSERERHGIAVVPLSVTLDGVSYVEGVSDEGFFAALKESKSFPTSSQPPVSAFTDVFGAAAEAGDEVVGVFISSDMSGTYSTAMLARDIVRETHPDAVIEIVDSRSNCMEEGFAVLAAAEAVEKGATAAEAAEVAHEMTLHTRFLFVPDTLEYLRRGGRIGDASALLGTLLQVRPILTVVDGHTSTFAKVRTKRKALAEIVAAFKRDIDEKGFVDAIVHHIVDEEEGRLLASLAQEVIGRPVPIVAIGPAIGMHVGPGTAALVYHTERPMDKRPTGKEQA